MNILCVFNVHTLLKRLFYASRISLDILWVQNLNFHWIFSFLSYRANTICNFILQWKISFYLKFRWMKWKNEWQKMTISIKIRECAGNFPSMQNQNFEKLNFLSFISRRRQSMIRFQQSTKLSIPMQSKSWLDWMIRGNIQLYYLLLVKVWMLAQNGKLVGENFCCRWKLFVT